MKHSFHIPSLDGIRAVAISTVFLAHLGFHDLIPGGFGVTLFFFLSGYLITTLLRREFEATRRISLRHFYLRRTLRIFPPLFITLFITYSLVVAGIIAGNVTLSSFLAQAAFLTNYFIIHSGGDYSLVPQGSGVLWSLAVEEHFYIFFPLLSALMLKRLSASRQARFILALCGLVFLWRCYLVYFQHVIPERTYIATDTRIDSILFGCLLALYHNPAMDPPLTISRTGKAIVYASALGVLLFCFLYRDSGFRETARYSLQGLALVPLFYFAITDHTAPWFRWLSWEPVRFIGLISYTLYLVHHVVISKANNLFAGGKFLGPALFAVAGCLLYAVLMYYLIERPCARLRKRLH